MFLDLTPLLFLAMVAWSIFLAVDAGEFQWELEKRYIQHQSLSRSTGAFLCWFVNSAASRLGLFLAELPVLVWMWGYLFTFPSWVLRFAELISTNPLPIILILIMISTLNQVLLAKWFGRSVSVWQYLGVYVRSLLPFHILRSYYYGLLTKYVPAQTYFTLRLSTVLIFVSGFGAWIVPLVVKMKVSQDKYNATAA